MIPRAKKIKSCSGVTLIGTLVAVVILMIALIGTSTLRYSAALDGRRAAAHTRAARVALVLSESWRGLNGAGTYDPTLLGNSEMSVSASSWKGHVTPDDFTLLGNYAIVLDADDPDSVNYYATLSWQDVKAGLRALNVSVAWAQRAPDADGTENVDKSYALTVYAETN